MDTHELRTKEIAELKQLDTELAEKIWKAKFNNMSGQLDDTSSILKLRKERARVQTVISEKANQKTSKTPSRGKA